MNFSRRHGNRASWRGRRSAGRFQLLRHGEQPGDGIPVSCSTGVLQYPIQQWRKFRASYAVGKIDVEFAPGDPQFLGIGFDSEKRFPSVRGGICGEEGDEKFAWVKVAMREKKCEESRRGENRSRVRSRSRSAVRVATGRVLWS